MDISTKVQDRTDEFLSIEFPVGKTLYLLCECCEKYIKKSEMTLFDYALAQRNCPTCYAQQREQLVPR
jgi:hypothetical protein